MRSPINAPTRTTLIGCLFLRRQTGLPLYLESLAAAAYKPAADKKANPNILFMEHADIGVPAPGGPPLRRGSR